MTSPKSHNLGFSNSKIVFGDGFVAKYDNKGQAEYLKHLGSDSFPEVYLDEDGCYMMEHLRGYPTSEIVGENKVYRLSEINYILSNCVWPREALPLSHDIFWREHLKKFLETLAAYDYSNLLDKLYGGEDVSTCLIHGDPTVANLMRRGSKPVLIDPIRPVGKIPSIKAVDQGKMLQSVLGWEELVLGLEIDTPKKLPELVPADVAFWCGVHHLRILPYLTHARRSLEKPIKERIRLCLEGVYKNVCI